jgi:hypothetical protein
MRFTPSAHLAILALFSVFSTATTGQTIPDAPKRHIDRTGWTLLSADASIRALDVYSTHQMLVNGNHEIFLPGFIADHTSTMAAFSAGMVGVNWWAARSLERHHHPKIAHLVTMIDIAQDAPWAIHNLMLSKRGKAVPRIRPFVAK